MFSHFFYLAVFFINNSFHYICNLFQIVAGNHADLGGISYLDMQQHNQAC